MKYLVFTFACLALATAVPIDLIEDDNGELYYLVPLSRERRQTNVGINDRGFGASHSGTLLNSGGHRVDGSAYANKNYGSHGLKPDQFGGRVDYGGGRTSAFGAADHTRNYGTDVSAGVRQNVHQSKNFGVDVTGGYNRHYGGPGGTGKPQGSIGVVGHGRF